MLNSIIQILSENFSLAKIGVFLTLLPAAVKVLRIAFDFHYDYITKRRLKKLSELQSSKLDGDVKEFVQLELNQEVFKISTGVNASLKESGFLIDIYKKGLARRVDLKTLSKYIDTKNKAVGFDFPKDKVFFAYFSIFFGVSMLLYGFFVFITLFFIGGVPEKVAGLLILICSIFIGLGISKDFREYKRARKINKLYDNS